jgi:transposase
MVRLPPPAHVKPYVRRNKNDRADAAAICEAAGRPSQRFVPVRSVENQAELMRHRAIAGQRTSLPVRSHREFWCNRLESLVFRSGFFRN